MARMLAVFLFILFLSLCSFFIPSILAQPPTESLTLTVYLDGYTQVDRTMQLNQQSLFFNLTIPAKAIQNFLVVDENNLPLEYSIQDNNALIYSIGSTQVAVSYITQDYTTKAGNYWTITYDCPERKVLILPKNASIITINTIPELIENTNGSIKLTMPPGLMEVTYTIEHILYQQNENPTQPAVLDFWPVLSILLISITVPGAFGGFLLLRQKKKNKSHSKQDQTQQEVDIDKIFSKNRELRQDESQVINYLASKNGKAFEAELFGLLNLPRTTTWRLIRRLEGLEIVTIKKIKKTKHRSCAR